MCCLISGSDYSQQSGYYKKGMLVYKVLILTYVLSFEFIFLDNCNCLCFAANFCHQDIRMRVVGHPIPY